MRRWYVAIEGKQSSLGRLLQYTTKSARRAWMAIYLKNVRINRERSGLKRTHRWDRFIIGDLEYTSQVTVSYGLKPVCPTKVLDDKSPCWAVVVTILERLVSCS